eukprot:TRINITY_DN6235_c2_g1_i2.p1 TRINITY_DN6235_c2_g1~~TRINITY_DN6235_c2_g1_i2.p1  ORF type:complete len:396 (+),score=106.97 TRINITY_DN6235_c2_g1_i2:128-1315(+)
MAMAQRLSVAPLGARLPPSPRASGALPAMHLGAVDGLQPPSPRVSVAYPAQLLATPRASMVPAAQLSMLQPSPCPLPLEECNDLPELVPEGPAGATQRPGSPRSPRPAAAPPDAPASPPPSAAHLQAVEADQARRLRASEVDNERLRRQVEALQRQAAAAASPPPPPLRQLLQQQQQQPAAAPRGLSPSLSPSPVRWGPESPPGGLSAPPCDDELPEHPSAQGGPPGPWLSAVLRLSADTDSAKDRASERRRRRRRRSRRAAQRRRSPSVAALRSPAARDAASLLRAAEPSRAAALSAATGDAEQSPRAASSALAAPPSRAGDAYSIRREVASTFWSHYQQSLRARLRDAAAIGAAQPRRPAGAEAPVSPRRVPLGSESRLKRELPQPLCSPRRH